MAGKKRRNVKTHPLVRGERDAADDFMPPDRPDVAAASETEPDGTAEVIDVLGDARPGAVATRDADGDDAGAGDDAPASQVMRREEPAEPAPARRQERDDRAVARQRARAADDGDDDDRGYSARVQKRIRRERAIVNRERALREQTERQLAEERTARQELADRVLQIERTSTKVAADQDVKALKAQIEALIPQIAAATEAGETQKALTLQIKLGELQGDLKVKEYDLTLRAQNARIVEENERKAKQEREAAAARAAAGGGDTLTAEQKERATDFTRANRRWWRRDKEAKEVALAIDREIMGEISDGELDFEPYSDEHIEELAERLHEEFPELEIRDLEREPFEFDDQDDGDGDRGGARGDRRGARVDNSQRGARRQMNGNRAPTGRLGQQRQTDNEVEMARQGRVRLTEADFKEMRIFKMDPNNPEHKKAFAQQRARTILERAQQADDQRGAR